MLIVFYSVQNEEGQELLHKYVSPLCARLNISLEVAPPNANRAHSLARQPISDTILLWDGSVEPGHIYHAMSDWIKNTQKHIIISRTPLPRNVLTYHQCAPIHGKYFNNEALREWLKLWLNRYSTGKAKAPSPVRFRNEQLANHYWFFDNPADLFLSYRGSQRRIAEEWSHQFIEQTGQTVRLVPQQQYAYETECVTRQQMWEVVACLHREMRATKASAIFLSEDYYCSFWTCSELFSLIKYPRNADGITINQGYLVADHSSTVLNPLAMGTPVFPVPQPTKKQENRQWRILNNSDPMSSAPDTRIPPSGPAKVLALLLRPSFGYFSPEFIGFDFWDALRVPCPHCKPRGRKPWQIDWDEHLKFELGEGTVDYYGYFSASPEKLQTGNIECPHCHNRIRLKNERPPRTLWMPLMTTEKDQTRPVIIEQPLWETEIL